MSPTLEGPAHWLAQNNLLLKDIWLCIKREQQQFYPGMY